MLRGVKIVKAFEEVVKHDGYCGHVNPMGVCPTLLLHFSFFLLLLFIHDRIIDYIVNYLHLDYDLRLSFYLIVLALFSYIISVFYITRFYFLSLIE